MVEQLRGDTTLTDLMRKSREQRYYFKNGILIVSL
jgi:hypothetical protein